MEEEGDLEPIQDKPVQDKPVQDKPVQDKPVQDKLKNISQKKIAVCVLICFLIVGLISLLIYLSFHEEQTTFDFSKPEGNYTGDIYDDYDILKASMMTRHGSSMHRKTCEDLEYGCCEIYTHCSVQQGYLDYHPLIISFRRTVPKDRIHSNCPSLDDLVHQWNIHYQNKTLPCESSEYGCCPSIHTGCDHSLREYRGNDQETVDYFKEVSGRTHKMKDAKIDESGTNCPGYYNSNNPEVGLINGWEDYYPSRDDDTDWIAIIICSIIVILCAIASQNK
jgi:hypothetical protein